MIAISRQHELLVAVCCAGPHAVDRRQVMAMGFEQDAAQRALEAVGWASAEAAANQLLG